MKNEPKKLTMDDLPKGDELKRLVEGAQKYAGPVGTPSQFGKDIMDVYERLAEKGLLGDDDPDAEDWLAPPN